MASWRIYYTDSVVDGDCLEDWVAAPSHDVQVIVEWRTPRQDLGEWKWTNVRDRFLWTGEDEYDPFNYGVIKFGQWMNWDDYEMIWETAAHGN